jgi:hypothetical protein
MQHRMNLRKLIHNLLKALEWETVDQVRIAGVWPLRKNEPDRPFDDRLSVARCYLSHLNRLGLDLVFRRREMKRWKTHLLWIRE